MVTVDNLVCHMNVMATVIVELLRVLRQSHITHVNTTVAMMTHDQLYSIFGIAREGTKRAYFDHVVSRESRRFHYHMLGRYIHFIQCQLLPICKLTLNLHLHAH